MPQQPAGRTPGCQKPINLPDRASASPLKRCADLCYRSILTLAALPDREHTWLHRMPGGSPAPVLSLADIQREWGPESAIAAETHLIEEQEQRANRHHPSPADISHYLTVLGWLSWLERERNGRNERRIICARAYGISYRSIAARFGRSDETMRRWEDYGLGIIAAEYAAEIEAMR